MDKFGPWHISNDRYDPESLAQFNSVFTVSNGYLALSGNVPFDQHGRQPLTVINGVFDELDMVGLIPESHRDRLYLDRAQFAGAGKSPAVANLPNPLLVRVFVGDEELALSTCDVLRCTQVLLPSTGDYRQGVELRDAAGRATRIGIQRFASIVNPHRAYMWCWVDRENHDAPVRVRIGIDASVRSDATGERQYEIRDLWTRPGGYCSADVRLPARDIDVHLRVATRDQMGEPVPCQGVTENDAACNEFEFRGPARQRVALFHVVVLASSEDARHGVGVDPDAELDDAIASVKVSSARQVPREFSAHQAYWEDLWKRVDVVINGDKTAQRYLRFCLYQLLASAPRHTDRLSVPVKLLTGQYYQGTTFYDTDVYILPFYTFALPEAARTCLHWRCLGVEPGRAYAREQGCPGAKLAWQAGPKGEECLGPWWRFTRTNIHVDSDAVYALMQYVAATGDEAFLHECGIDLLAETARFLAARARHDADRDAFDLHDVTGPDEGHVGVTNDFYTNYLAIRSLWWAAQWVERIARDNPDAYARAAQRLSLEPDEPDRWRYVADRLTLRYDPRTKVYEQHDEFHALDPLPPAFAADRTEWFGNVADHQALNQPDVVMAMAMFRDAFDEDTRRANWEHYKDKSMNFSSMSFALNAIMAADVGDMDEAYRSFIISAGMDLDPTLTGRRDTREGLHGTAAGGAWMAVVFGFGGVCLTETGLRIAPNLPPRWTGLRFNLLYRGGTIRVSIRRKVARVTADGGPDYRPVLDVDGEPVTLAGGASIRLPCRR